MKISNAIGSYLFIIALSIFPLLRFSVEDTSLTRGTWRGLAVIIFAIFIIFLLNYKNVQQKNIHATLISLAILCISAGLSISHPHLVPMLYCTIGILFAGALVITIHKKNALYFIVTLIACVSLYSQWGIAQFIIQHNLGLSKIGESILTINTPGVASFYIHGEKLIRSYGPFSHANLLGGIIVIALILVTKIRNSIKPVILYSFLLILLLGLITSFSRTAIASTLLLAGILFIWKKQKVFLLSLLTLTILFSPLLITRSTDSRDVSVHDRVEGLTWARNLTTQKSFIRGLGLGNYEQALDSYLTKNSIPHYAWDIAPVHSVHVFIIMEFGIVISILVTVTILYFIIKNKAWLILILMPTILFDHYFATQLGALAWLTSCAIILSRVY